MLTNLALTNAVSEKDIQLLDCVMLLLNSVVKMCQEVEMPESSHPRLNCHSICRALARNVQEVRCVDGFVLGLQPDQSGQLFLVRTQHSWLLTADQTIIDPYPVGYITNNPVIAGKGRYSAFGSAAYRADTSVTGKVITHKMIAEEQYLVSLMRAAIKQIKRT